MPDFGRGDSGRFNSRGPNDGDSLDAIARSDQLLDALAGQRRIPPSDQSEAELLALLEGWRDGVRQPSSAHVISEREAADAVRQGLAQRPTAHKGTRRHLAVVGSVAAAVACVGGFGAIVAGAGPGDSMYGMRTALFGEPQSVRDDRVALAAQTEMAEVQRLIEQGDWDQAQVKLETITTAVADVEDTSVQQELQQQWDLLNVRVESQDPAATLPPPVTPGPETVPGDGVTVTLPSGETTTTPSAETSGETTSPSEPAPSTSPSEGATSQSPTPSTSAAPSTSTSTTPSTTTPSTTPSTSATTTATTTTTSPSPTTTTTTRSATSTTTTTTTTTLPQADGPEPTTATAPAQLAPSSTLIEAETETVPTAQEAPSAQEVPPSSVLPTTTTTVPAPPAQLPVPEPN
jgi:hypothetical protein